MDKSDGTRNPIYIYVALNDMRVYTRINSKNNGQVLRDWKPNLHCLWRWGELNPRPKKQHSYVYRFIGARWLSGNGSSTTSVVSVFWLKVPHKDQTQYAARLGLVTVILTAQDRAVRLPCFAYAARANCELDSPVNCFRLFKEQAMNPTCSKSII